MYIYTTCRRRDDRTHAQKLYDIKYIRRVPIIGAPRFCRRQPLSTCNIFFFSSQYPSRLYRVFPRATVYKIISYYNYYYHYYNCVFTITIITYYYYYYLIINLLFCDVCYIVSFRAYLVVVFLKNVYRFFSIHITTTCCPSVRVVFL